MIEAFQHIGIGVTDIDRSYHFYKNILGFSIKLNDHEEEMEQMVEIIGSLCRMRVIMAMNLSGGGAVELVQHTDSEPRMLPRTLRWGDKGYLAMGVKAYRLTELVERLEKKGATFITPVITTEVSQGGMCNSIYLRDPDGLTVELLETAELRLLQAVEPVRLAVQDVEGVEVVRAREVVTQPVADLAKCLELAEVSRRYLATRANLLEKLEHLSVDPEAPATHAHVDGPWAIAQQLQQWPPIALVGDHVHVAPDEVADEELPLELPFLCAH